MSNYCQNCYELAEENERLKTCLEMIKNTEGQAHIKGMEMAKKLEKIKEVLSFCYGEEGTEIPCVDCKYYKECGIQPIDYVIKIIEGAEDE